MPYPFSTISLNNTKNLKEKAKKKFQYIPPKETKLKWLNKQNIKQGTINPNKSIATESQLNCQFSSVKDKVQESISQETNNQSSWLTRLLSGIQEDVYHKKQNEQINSISAFRKENINIAAPSQIRKNIVKNIEQNVSTSENQINSKFVEPRTLKNQKNIIKRQRNGSTVSDIGHQHPSSNNFHEEKNTIESSSWARRKSYGAQHRKNSLNYNKPKKVQSVRKISQTSEIKGKAEQKFTTSAMSLSKISAISQKQRSRKKNKQQSVSQLSSNPYKRQIYKAKPVIQANSIHTEPLVEKYLSRQNYMHNHLCLSKSSLFDKEQNKFEQRKQQQTVRKQKIKKNNISLAIQDPILKGNQNQQNQLRNYQQKYQNEYRFSNNYYETLNKRNYNQTEQFLIEKQNNRYQKYHKSNEQQINKNNSIESYEAQKRIQKKAAKLQLKYNYLQSIDNSPQKQQYTLRGKGDEPASSQRAISDRNSHHLRNQFIYDIQQNQIASFRNTECFKKQETFGRDTNKYLLKKENNSQDRLQQLFMKIKKDKSLDTSLNYENLCSDKLSSEQKIQISSIISQVRYGHRVFSFEDFKQKCKSFAEKNRTFRQIESPKDQKQLQPPQKDYKVWQRLYSIQEAGVESSQLSEHEEISNFIQRQRKQQQNNIDIIQKLNMKLTNYIETHQLQDTFKKLNLNFDCLRKHQH